jgi:glutamate dehydrogenase
MDGQGLVRLILKAEADLLWNGGIGTYVKADAEKNEDAGDRANDSVRVDASQLKVKVVGEGGNLGLTQLGRIQYALRGGRINTDAVDNSGGVDCSDHEVNLKIFMQFLKEKGKLASGEERDRLLEEVTEDICRNVLANNYGQSLCLSLDLKRCSVAIETFFELTERLSQAGLLDRKGEFLPGEKEVLARSRGMLTRPELSILMAYSKMHLYQALLESDLPDGDSARTLLLDYFPEALRERFRKDLPLHPLAREIAATVITNLVVNQAGSTFVNRLARRTGAAPVKIVESYLFFDRILGGYELRRQVFDLDNQMSSDSQQELLLRLEEALAEFCFWAVEHDLEIGEEFFGKVKEGVREFEKILGGILPESEWNPCRQYAADLEKGGLVPEAAHTYAVLPFLRDFLPIQAVADDVEEDLYTVSQTYNEVRKILDLRKILHLLDQVQERDHWDRLAHQTLKRDYATVAFGLTRVVLRENKGNPEGFFAARRQKVALYRRQVESLRGGTPVNYHPFTVMVRSLESLLE